MGHWLKFFVELCFLKAAPQDAPSSRTVQYLAIFFYWSFGTALLLNNYPILSAALVATVQTVLGLFLIRIVLWIKNTPERIGQTVTAYMGSGAIIVIAAFPLFSWMAWLGSEYSKISFVIWMLLLIWETVVTGNILRHAMSLPFAAGLGIALIFMYLTFAITVRFVKILSIELN